MAVLAIETSTSSAKAMLYDGGVLSVRDVPYEAGSANVITIDAAAMLRAVTACVHAVLEGFSGRVEAVGLCGIWHSLLLLDENGEPMGPISTWANGFADETAAAFRRDETAARAFYHKTGCVVHSNYPLWQYRHLWLTGDERVKRTAAVSSQLEYLFCFLTGRRAASLCTATGSGMVNLHTLRYDPELLALAGLKEEQLAPLREPCWHAPLCGRAARLLGLPEGVPVTCGGADGALNQIGSGAMESGIMTLSVGTSAAMRMCTDAPLLPETPSTWCYYLADKKYIMGAATSGACNCLNWLVEDVFGGRFSYGELDHSWNTADMLDAPVFLPYNYGERCPHWNPRRTGGFFGLKGNPGKEQLYYAVLEGVCCNLYHCYTLLRTVTAEPGEIRVSGGIIKSAPWLQLLSDLFGKPLHVSLTQHASTVGAAALALRAAGVINALEEFTASAGAEVMPAAGTHAFLQQRFARYLAWEQQTEKGGQ